jgi:hypothetical protein
MLSLNRSRRRPVMRRSLSLGLLLVALSALPAAAGSRGGTHGFFAFHEGHFAKHFAAFRTRSRFFGAWGSGWGWGDWADWDGGPGGGGPGTMIVVAGGPPAGYAPPPAAPARATVETEAGVTVVRGPGTHHDTR